MKYRFVASTIVIAVVLLCSASMRISAQAPARPAKAWTAPRTADGHSDLQGTWNYSTLTPMERPRELAGKAFFTEQEAADYEKRSQQNRNVDNNRETTPTSRGVVNGSVETEDLASAYNEFWWDRGSKIVSTRRTSIVIDPADGKIPSLTPQAQNRMAVLNQANERLAEGPEDRPLSERCIVRPNSGPPMTPTGYNNNFQLIQAPGYVVIFNEQIHDARIVPMDARPHLPQSVRQWMGDSRGHWEGDTLVIDTTNFTDKANFRGSGENLHLVAGQEELAFHLDFAARLARQHFRILDGPLLAFLGDDGFAVVADFGGEGNGFGCSGFGRVRLCGRSAEQEKGSYEKRGH